MKSPLRVGERVAFYSGRKRIVTYIKQIDGDALLLHDAEEKRSAVSLVAHPKQCRRLKKRERRRVWINPEAVFTLDVMGCHPVDGWTEYREVLPKKERK